MQPENSRKARQREAQTQDLDNYQYVPHQVRAIGRGFIRFSLDVLGSALDFIGSAFALPGFVLGFIGIAVDLHWI